jgi:hypothetical protein
MRSEEPGSRADPAPHARTLRGQTGVRRNLSSYQTRPIDPARSRGTADRIQFSAPIHTFARRLSALLFQAAAIVRDQFNASCRAYRPCLQRPPLRYDSLEVILVTGVETGEAVF